ncbi:hypothetical protein BHE74_00051215, partial [Ensete ventricosum]
EGGRKKKWEKKNLEIGTALRPHDLSPADDFFSLHGEKKRGDVLFMGEYSHISMNFDDVSYLFTVPCRAASRRRGRRKTWSSVLLFARAICRPRAISSPCVGRRNVSPRGEKEQGDIVLVILDNYEVQQMSSGNSKQDFQCSQDENHLVEEVGRVKDHVSSFQDSWKKVFSVPQITTIEVDATVLEPYCCGKTPYRPVHSGPTADQYTDHPLPSGTAKIDRRRSIKGEIDHRRPIEGEKGKKKMKMRRRKKKKRRRRGYIPPFPVPTPPTRRPRPRVARTLSSPTGDSSPVRGDGTSHRAGRKMEA